MNYENEAGIQYAVAKYFGWRLNIIVPNVYWGLINYEADLLILSEHNYVTEIEIKTSKADLMNEKYKKHKHDSIIVRKLYYAIPEKLKSKLSTNHFREDAGIIIVDKQGYVSIYRDAKVRKNVKAIELLDKYKLARLGAMRMWNLFKLKL